MITHYDSPPATPYPWIQPTGIKDLETVPETRAPIANMRKADQEHKIPETPEPVSKSSNEDPANRHNTAILHFQSMDVEEAPFYKPITNETRDIKNMTFQPRRMF